MLTDYERDEADFAGFNPSRFTPDWKTDWHNAILAARGTPSDNNTVNLGTDLTAQQERAMEAARQNYQHHIKPFIEDAFKATQSGLMSAFGVNNYLSARSSVSRMMPFLDNLAARCAEYANELAAVGINPAKVALITTHLNDLQTHARSRNAFPGERSIATSKRNQLFEAMDAFAEQTARAGKHIFKSNHPRYNRYVIYGGSDSPSPRKTHTVAAGESILLFAKQLDEDSGFRFNNEGSETALVFVSNSPADHTPHNALHLLPEGKDVRALANELLLGAGTYGGLVVRNNGTSEVKLSIQLLKVVRDG